MPDFRPQRADKKRGGRCGTESHHHDRYTLVILANGANRRHGPLFASYRAAQNKEQLAALLPEASKAAALADQATRMLPLAVAGPSHAPVDSDQLVEGRVGPLLLTVDEKRRLMNSLLSLFREEMKTSKGGYATEVAPSLLWQCLNQPWKTSNTPG